MFDFSMCIFLFLLKFMAVVVRFNWVFCFEFEVSYS